MSLSDRFSKLSAFSKLSLFSLLLLAFATVSSISLSLSQQRFKSGASFANQSAVSKCDDSGKAVIDVSFTNTVSDNALSMNVTAKDVQTGISMDIGSIGSQQTGSARISTNRPSLDGSSVIFFLTWADDPTSTSQAGATYSSITCVLPTSTPTEIPATPTLTPTPTPTDEPTQTPTVAPTLTPTPTNTPTPTPLPAATLTPLPTSTPTPTLTPTPTPPDTSFNFNVLLHGIGQGGDIANPSSSGNKNPLHKSVNIAIDVYNSQNQLILSKTGIINYASESGSFTSTVNMGNTLTSGFYTVKIKADKYLRASIPGIISVVAGSQNTLKKVDLAVGDINNDNLMNILDYNLLMGCYSDLYPPKSCTNSQAADLTDDGYVNQFDYNLFLRELTTKGGE